MRRLKPALVAVAAVAAGGAVAVAGADASRTPAGGYATVLTLEEVTTQFYFGDDEILYPRRPGGRGAGNLLFSSGDLYDGARKAGTNVGTCVTVADAHTRIENAEGPGIGTPRRTPGAPAVNVAHCTYDVALAGGTINVEGRFDQTAFEGDCLKRLRERYCSGSTETLAVLGGTGEYAGATGQAELTQVEYPDVIRMVVRLR